MTLEQFKQSVDLYVTDRIQPGSFVTAILSNDLMGAVIKADNESSKLLVQFVDYVLAKVPMNLYGSAEIVNNHIHGK